MWPYSVSAEGDLTRGHGGRDRSDVAPRHGCQPGAGGGEERILPWSLRREWVLLSLDFGSMIMIWHF